MNFGINLELESPFRSSVTLDASVSFSMLQFLHPKNGIIVFNSLAVVWIK